MQNIVKPSSRARRSEVAERAGVSEATVSFVFSGKRFVSEDLRTRVLAAASELDYQPDLIARSMVTKNTETIAVLTSDMASPLQMEVIKSIQSEAMKNGFYVYVCGGEEHLEKYIDNFIARRVDGVFLSVVSDLVGDAYIKKMLDRGISVVISSARRFDDERICGLELDFNYGMREIVRYLKGLGHRDIAYISCFDRDYEADKRLGAFIAAVRDELDADEPILECGSFPYDSRIEDGYILTERLLSRGIGFTSAVCTNDLMAMGAISALRERGLSVPDDVSVVGIDDIIFAKSCLPPLTTLSHCAKEYGREIFKILHANIADKSVVTRKSIPPELIIRKSAAACRKR